MNSIASTSRASHFMGAPVISRSTQSRAHVRLSVVSSKTEEGGFDLMKLAGGRSGLPGGEFALKTDAGKEKLFGDAAREKEQKMKAKNTITNFAEGDEDIYVGSGRYMKGDSKKLPAKENVGFFVGATGGFAGGEELLWTFRDEVKKQMAADRKVDIADAMVGRIDPKKAMMSTPLLMPGMNAVVSAERSPYHMFTGIVQRISDGKAQVLFEGGNWDKSVTFKLEDLERSKSGPPGEHPKSAILNAKIAELQAMATPSEAETA
eukprot:CAMPEP_0196595540 /NCGR_PEP_ID=MMETSP1081-20130531/81344_1 /TAXON_ID=36882 /ORGANISM="Pyramimonas amylifera, Strain CCMP720" /LENGTH=262 /DNA_ID=CAMNT_0041920149 /DNA_START=182 /DNA_END=970 /DNA_ORIENTATION=+